MRQLLKSFFYFLVLLILIAICFVAVAEMQFKNTLAEVARLCNLNIERINYKVNSYRIDRFVSWDVKYSPLYVTDLTCSGTAKAVWDDQKDDILSGISRLPTNRKSPKHIISGYSKFGRFSMCETLECDFHMVLYDEKIAVISVFKH